MATLTQSECNALRIAAPTGGITLLGTGDAAPAASVTVTAPVAGAQWQHSGTENITWSAVGIDNVDILLSQDGGATFPTTLTTSVIASSGTWEWSTIDAGITTTTGTVVQVKESGGSTTGSSGLFALSGSLTSGCSAFWELDEVSGQRNDSVGSNHLTDNNTVGQGAGVIGFCGDFTKANTEFLSITDNAALSGKPNLTVSCFCKPKGVGSSFSIMGKYTTTGNKREYLLWFQQVGDKFAWSVSSDGTGGVNLKTVNGDSSAPLLADTWYHVMAWRNDTDGLLYLNVDGVKDSGTAPPGMYDGTADFTIGVFDSSVWPADALIDLAGVWNRNLTSAEGDALNNSGAGRSWPFPT